MESPNNHNKRKFVKIYNTDKIPTHAKKSIKNEWTGIIRQDINSDPQMFYFYTTQLYELAMSKLQSTQEPTTLEELELVHNKIIQLQKMLCCGNYEEYKKYNQKCSSGKLCLSSVVFLCICSLNQFILTRLDSASKVTDEQLERAFKWALESKTVTLTLEELLNCSQMNLYIQVQTLASDWYGLKRHLKPERGGIGNGNEAFLFMGILEDRLSHILIRQCDEETMDGTEGVWSKKVSKKDETLLVPTMEYIDDMSNIFIGFYRSLYLFEKVESSFIQAQIPQHDFDLYKDLYYKWIKEQMYESVLPDYLDDARQVCIYYCVREGEVEKSLRKKNGVKAKSMKWVLHAGRCFKQIVWMLQEHTYDKGGTIIKHFPRKWQKHGLKLNVFINILGAYKIKFCERVFVQERNFWRIFNTNKDIIKNPIIVEIMGQHMVVCERNYYLMNSVEDALLLWVIMLKRVKKGVFINDFTSIDLTTVIDSYLSQWDTRFNNASQDIGGEGGECQEDEMDIVM